MAIRKLTPEIHEKSWGTPRTSPWLANPEGRNVGEIWFAAPEALPLLVKFLFTSDRLSVQVHPDDAYAQSRGEARGKTEMWHVLRAEGNASVAVGLRREVPPGQLGAAAGNAAIVGLLEWMPASVGDTFFVPSGTIHAIGNGLVLCEVQQFSDITYRLYDFDRVPVRPLHLADSLAVARPVTDGGRADFPVECPYFRTERIVVHGTADCPASSRPAILVAIEGQGSVAGEPFQAGEALLMPGGDGPVSVHSNAAVLLRVSVPESVR